MLLIEFDVPQPKLPRKMVSGWAYEHGIDFYGGCRVLVTLGALASTLGLALDIAGVILIFHFALPPRVNPTGQSSSGSARNRLDGSRQG